MNSNRRNQSKGIPVVTFDKEPSHQNNLKSIKIVRNSNEDKKTSKLTLNDFDVKETGYTASQMCPLYQRCNSENFMIARFDSKCPKHVTSQILSNGVDVCFRTRPGFTERYAFFGHSASQLRSRVCVLYKNNPSLGRTEEIIRQFGDFTKLKTAAKRAARIGLLLSTAGRTVELREHEIDRVDDIEREGYTFTDGCGYISPVVAKKVAEHLSIAERYEHQKYPYPSVFQIRLMGCKGVLALKPSLEKGIQIRPSMEKFKWLLPEPFPLGVVDKGYSRPYEVGSLNKQFILLLSALGIKDEVFLRKQKTYFEEIRSLTKDKETAFIYLCAFEEIEIAERLLKSNVFDNVVLSKLKSIQQKAYTSPSNPGSEPERSKKLPAVRLKIPVEKSRNVYGVSDPSENDLEYGSCFFQPTIRGEAKPIIGRIVVAKNPCYSPGDVRVLNCVDRPSCHHLVDCIVFPTRGKRPHPDEIAGSDLDGDKFFVCWDPDLIPYESQEPVSYPSANVPSKDNIDQKDLIDYFSRYSNSAIGKIDALFQRWADRKGVSSAECQMLSALFSRAIDSAKTGEKVQIPKHLEIGVDDETLHGNFVWHKMAAEAIIFLEKKINNPTRSDEVQLTKETLIDVLSNRFISVTDYQLFRFLCIWAEREKIADLELAEIAKECIDFTSFSLPQLRGTQLDCPQLTADIVLNPFLRSKILTEFDCKKLFPDFMKTFYPYSLVFHADAEDLSWEILNNILTSSLAKILVFQLLLGDMDWICVLKVPQQLQVRETLQVDDVEHSPPKAYLFLHHDQAVSEEFTLDHTYSFSLYDQRLQIYQGTKGRTFVSFNINDANALSVISIDLQRFNPRLSTRYGGIRVRKEEFVRLEVYCLDPSLKPIPKICFTEPPTALKPQETLETAAHQFYSLPEDFPLLGDEYGGIYSLAMQELQRLHDLREKGSLSSHDFSGIYKLLQKMGQNPMERHEWACRLESLLVECDIAYGDVNYYAELMIYLLDGLKTNDLRVISGSKVNITLLRRVTRVLENMQKNSVSFRVENIVTLFETLLFMHDYRTSVFLVKLLNQGKFPIAEELFLLNEKYLPYFVHWCSLLYLELLEDVKEQENIEIRHAANSITCEGIVSKEDAVLKNAEPLYTIFIQKGETKCLPGDCLALSPCNAERAFRERKYIVEVKSCSGKSLSTEVIWPKCKDEVSQGLSRYPSWKIVSFPNLISFTRMLDALTKLCTKGSLDEKGVFAELLASWRPEPVGRDVTQGESPSPQINNSTVNSTPGVMITSVDSSHDGDFVATGAGENKESESCHGKESANALNSSQERAVRQACNNSLTLIQGPPGTGKSKTSACVIKEFLDQDAKGKILAVAETNEGVDNLLEKIVDIVAEDVSDDILLRVGSSTWTVRPALRKYTLESKYAKLAEGKLVKENWMDKKIVKKIFDGSKIFCTTCSSSGSKILEDISFSMLLVDEASQATEPAILVPICRGNKTLVLVGDDQQLPPTVKSIDAKGLKTTTFSRLRSSGHPVYLLDTQYRMHPSISKFPSDTFYGGRLKDGVSAEQRVTPKGFSWPDQDRPLAFINTPKDYTEQGGRSKKNVKEAEVVKLIIEGMLREGDLKPDEIGIVTPYSAQVNLLTQVLKNHANVSIRSVDGFQGQERELIIFSAVRCNDFGHCGFLVDDKRMNVLLTRARRGLIVIGNRDTLASRLNESQIQAKNSEASTWRKWVKWMEKEQLIVASESLFPLSTKESGEQRRQAADGSGKSGRGPGGRERSGRRGNPGRGKHF